MRVFVTSLLVFRYPEAVKACTDALTSQPISIFDKLPADLPCYQMVAIFNQIRSQASTKIASPLASRSPMRPLHIWVE